MTIFSLLFSYNEYLIASIFLRDEGKMTIPIGVQMFMQQFQTEKDYFGGSPKIRT